MQSSRLLLHERVVLLRRELSLHLLIRNVLNRFHGADYARLLDLLNPKTIELLGRYNRDHAAKMLCRILAQPRFCLNVHCSEVESGQAQPVKRSAT